MGHNMCSMSIKLIYTLNYTIHWTHNTHAYDVILKKQMRFCILNRFNNGMIFENLDFETRFQLLN